jgi:hypothetical protein
MAGDSALQQAKAEMGRVEDNLVRLANIAGNTTARMIPSDGKAFVIKVLDRRLETAERTTTPRTGSARDLS